MVFIRQGKIDDVVQMSRKGDLDIGVAVMGFLDFRAFAEQGIGLVEKQDRVAGMGWMSQ